LARIYKRGKSYYLDYSYQGRRIRKRVGPSKQIALLALKDIEVRIARNEYNLATRDCEIEQLFERFRSYSAVNHAPNTQRRYDTIIKNFGEFLGSHKHIKKASQINMELIENYKEFRRIGNQKNAKTTTVNIELKGIKAILNRAVQWNLLSHNPVAQVKLLKVSDASRPRFLSEEECQLLLSKAPGDYRDIFYIFLHTGMRLGELVNLEWSDIDFKRRKIQIRKKTNWNPKGKERDLPLTDGLHEILYRRYMQDRRESSYVFYFGDGVDLRKRIKRTLGRTTAKCGFPDVTKVHVLRHTGDEGS